MQKRKSADVLNEAYSPIKEAKDENSLEEDKKNGESSVDDSDYTSVNNSESTLKHKYSNAAGGVNVDSNSMSRQVVVEDSMVSSSYVMSSVGGDDKLKAKL